MLNYVYRKWKSVHSHWKWLWKWINIIMGVIYWATYITWTCVVHLGRIVCLLFQVQVVNKLQAVTNTICVHEMLTLFSIDPIDYLTVDGILNEWCLHVGWKKCLFVTHTCKICVLFYKELIWRKKCYYIIILKLFLMHMFAGGSYKKQL